MRTPSLLAALLSATAVAQQPAPEHLAIAQAWTAFQAENGPAWTASWNPATATPEAIHGTGIRLSPTPIQDLDTARRHAAQVLDRYADLLGRGNSTFVEDIAAPTANLFVFVHRQRYRGLEVLGGRADLRIHRNGVLSMLGSRAVPIPVGFPLDPLVPAEAAWAIAHGHLEVEPRPAAGAIAPRPAAELLIHAEVEALAPARPRLAWRVQIDVRDRAEPVVAKVYVDARTGTVLGHVDEVYRCAMGHVHVAGEPTTHGPVPVGHLGRALARSRAAAPAPISGNVRGYLNRGASPLDPLTDTPLQGLRVTADGVGTAFTDANGDFSIPHSGTAPVDVRVDFGSGSGQHLSGGIQALQGSPVATTVRATPGTPVQIQLLGPTAGDFDWSQTTVFWHVDDANRWLRSLVGDVGPLAQLSRMSATVNRASSCNAFYTGNTINFYAAGGTCNMTGFSSVIYHEWGHGLDDVFGGISQVDGLSEAWGDIVATYRMDDPIVGKDFTTTGGIVRTALNTKTYPVGGFPSGGAPHPKGEVFMGWAWDLRNNLIASLGRSAGIARAEAIVVASIVADATDQPAAVREVFLLDDDDGNLANGTPNYAALEAASIRRALPYPELRVVDITHAALTTTERPLEPRIVRVGIAPVTGSVIRAEILFGATLPTQRRPLVPTGQGDEHVAILPGQPSPATMQYRIEVQHSSGRTVTLPRAGFFEYRTGRLETIFAEDFEGTPTGWTTAGSGNEWQFGQPQGRSGTSLGLAWADPSAAAEGSRAAGVDLGLPGQGAYEWFSNQTLTSPPIDLRGRTAPVLRFARWLSISALDTATLTANGQTLFTSSAENESAWTTVEYDLSAFAGQTVTLRWTLASLLPFQAGGWNIDEVRVTSFSSSAAPPVELRVLPEQIPLGTPATLSIQGAPAAPIALLLSTTPGPLTIPGLGTLFVGGQIEVLPTALDGSGQLTAGFQGPTDPSAIGTFAYAQVLQVRGGTLELSNGMILLFAN